MLLTTLQYCGKCVSFGSTFIIISDREVISLSKSSFESHPCGGGFESSYNGLRQMLMTCCIWHKILNLRTRRQQ